MDSPSPTPGQPARSESARLSYKFQRLRERLRAAVVSGELSGKLPGERVLARRFRVNAKTLSKALTDLAAEGLLERSIGRGTFVRTTITEPVSQDERWLLVCEPWQIELPSVRGVINANPLCQIVTETSSLRPSFLNQFKAVIYFARPINEAFIRDLIVRNASVVLVDHEPSTFSTHCVIVDRTLGITQLTRDVLMSGHQKIAIIDTGDGKCFAAATSAAARIDASAVVRRISAETSVAAVREGSTAILCDSSAKARLVRGVLSGAGLSLPGDVSLGAVGTRWEAAPCSGYFVHVNEKLEAMLHLLRDSQLRRPTPIWLSGAFCDVGTLGACKSPRQPQMRLTDTGS